MKLMRTGMNADWSWDRSAREYVRLYEEIRRQGPVAKHFARRERTDGARLRSPGSGTTLKFARGCSEHIFGSRPILLPEALIVLSER